MELFKPEAKPTFFGQTLNYTETLTGSNPVGSISKFYRRGYVCTIKQPSAVQLYQGPERKGKMGSVG
jgi:hypothetical protein